MQAVSNKNPYLYFSFCCFNQFWSWWNLIPCRSLQIMFIIVYQRSVGFGSCINWHSPQSALVALFGYFMFKSLALVQTTTLTQPPSLLLIPCLINYTTTRAFMSLSYCWCNYCRNGIQESNITASLLKLIKLILSEIFTHKFWRKN